MPCPAATTGVCTRVLNGDPCALGAPQAMDALNLRVHGGTDSLTLFWDPIAGETVRIIIRKADNTFKYEEIVARVDGTVVITGLEPNAFYYVSARSEKVVGSENQYVYGSWETVYSFVNPDWDDGTKFVVHRSKQVLFNSSKVVFK